jgi:hypothetical protein
VIESILLGVTGNYGEAIYPASGNDWTADIHGPYHTHAGFWAADPYAIKSWQDFVAHKYKTTEALRASWGAKAPELSAVQPFLKDAAPNDRAWVDFVDWYQQSMTDYADFWLKETRRNFAGEIYLCTGGHAPPEHGADFGQQCRVAAGIHGGVRITNEASDYSINCLYTRWVASAARQYGAYFSFEPAGAVTPAGVTVRIYNATASGAHGLHYYWPNLVGTQQASENFLRFADQWKARRPITEIALHYPSTYIKLNARSQSFLEPARTLRDRFDFALLSDGQIDDDGLKDVKALVLFHGNVAEAKTWEKIHRWVTRGGVLITFDGLGKLRSVEGKDVSRAILQSDPGKGRVLIYHGTDEAAYRDFISTSLASCDALSSGTRKMIQADGREDGAYVTLFEKELLWLNVTDRPLNVSLGVLPPTSIVSEPLK